MNVIATDVSRVQNPVSKATNIPNRLKCDSARPIVQARGRIFHFLSFKADTPSIDRQHRSPNNVMPPVD